MPRRSEVSETDISATDLTPHESLTVVENSVERLVVDVTYAPGGSAPPTHYHPCPGRALRGSLGRAGREARHEKRELRAGDVLEIPRGTPHAMWNAATSRRPPSGRRPRPGRTLDWFRNLDAIPGKPGAISLAPALLAYDDVFRLAGPRWLIRPLLRVLTVLSRREVLVAADLIRYPRWSDADHRDGSDRSRRWPRTSATATRRPRRPSPPTRAAGPRSRRRRPG